MRVRINDEKRGAQKMYDRTVRTCSRNAFNVGQSKFDLLSRIVCTSECECVYVYVMVNLKNSNNKNKMKLHRSAIH